MAEYVVSDVVSDVKICIDENTSNDLLTKTSDVDTLTLDEIIRAKIVDGVKRIENVAPIHLLDTTAETLLSDFNGYKREDYNEGDDGKMILDLANFTDEILRFVALKMAEWSRPCYEFITPESPKYAQLSSYSSGIRGSRQKPVCAVIPGPEGQRLEVYPISEDPDLEYFLYVPMPEISPAVNGKEYIRISKKCYAAAIYTISALVMSTLGNADAATTFFELAKSSIS